MLHHARHALIAALAVGAPTGFAHAGGLDADLTSARAIARAGATIVSEDGAAALRINPAGLVRRGATRLQVGIVLHDRDATYRSLDAQTTGSPTITDRGRAAALPSLGLQHGVGSVVLGMSYATTG